jgi:alginate O-acetyltransferase complex protein AlgI
MIYWLAYKSLRLQNICLLFASCYFYGSWDYRFLFLLLFSISLDYFTGLRMGAALSKRNKKLWLFISVFVNLGFLGLFKYYNFFIQSFSDLMNLLGLRVHYKSLEVILPVGISFYTFHGLSYVIDIYKDRIKPEKDFVNYSLFVSFFPLLVAGPIERATHLLPQIKTERRFDYQEAVAGMRQILWGLFKKMVIADNCANFANEIFNHASSYSGATLVLGAVFFAFQIYCDFSGYSEMAIGIARLFGFDLFRNFAFPYFSRDIAEFWRRWHISLSSWFRDYLYIPLGGSRGNTWLKVRNILIIFLVSGFWHGANWTFLVWGLLNALYILPAILLGTNKKNNDVVAQGRYLPTFRELLSMAFTFSLTVFAWIFFRSENIHQAFKYISGIFSRNFFTRPEIGRDAKSIILLTTIFMIVEWLGREQNYALASINNKFSRFTCYVIYYVIIVCIFYFSGKEQAFIYFQF